MLIPKFLKKDKEVSQQEWIADAMIDLLDLDRLGIKFNLRFEQREAIKNALIEHNVEQVYFSLKKYNIKEQDIANVLFTSIIKNKTKVDLDETFTLEELEEFIGYNRVKGTGLVLKNYQVPIVQNIDKNLKTRNFTAVIMPTGSGKSYIALAEIYKFEQMLKKLEKNRHAKILYLAPNEEILNQLKDIIRETYKPEAHLDDEDIDMDIKRLFPGLTLTTYQNLADRTKPGNELKEQFKQKYDLIIMDELHRTGAKEWQKNLEELMSYQDSKTKVLGLTATPERDVDSKDMSEYWARKFGYTEEEILEKKHLSYELDIIDAIKLGIVTNPQIINCMYSLKNEVEELKFSIDKIKNNELKTKELGKYEKIIRSIESAVGIEQILNENIKEDSKYIVFLPVTRKCEDDDGNIIQIDEDGNEIKRSVAHQTIMDYQTLVKQFLFSDEYLKQNPNVKNIYNKITNNQNLDEGEINYLNQEKENILLLAKFKMKYKQNELITINDSIASEIIKYMKWKKLPKKELASKLHEKMEDRIEDYSMLGSYGAKANKVLLDKFNKPTTGKTKLMFVMNKLNEGVHAKGLSGIIWFRAISPNSPILFQQQFGRPVKAIDANQKDDKNNVPVIIDLVNNTLRVKIKKELRRAPMQNDLDNIIMLQKWVNKTNRIPNGKSKNQEEHYLAKIIVELQKKYLKYINDPSLLTDDMVKEKTIIKIGCEFDIWNAKIEFDKSNPKTKSNSPEDDFTGILEVSAIARAYVELEDELEKMGLNMTPAQWVRRIQEYCETYHEWPNKKNESKDNKTKDGKTAENLANWLRNYDYNKGEFKYASEELDGRSLQEILDDLKERYKKKDRNLTPQKWVRRMQEYCETYHEWPNSKKESKDNKAKDGKTAKNLVNWLNLSGYNRGEFKHANEELDGRSLQEILDDLKEKYKEKDSILTLQEWVRRIQEYCETYHEWPNKKKESKDNKTKDGKTAENLADWLKHYGYNRGEFKYANEELDGRSLQEILDDLKERYKKKDRNLTSQEWVRRMQEYCETYHEWPNSKKESKDNKTKDGKTAKNLVNWLNLSGYNRGEFKHANEELDGRSLQEILDELYQKYDLKKYLKLKQKYDAKKHDNVVELVLNSKENKNARKL